MAHDIFGERFLSLRQPAWHALGTVATEEMGAWEALRVIGGEYDTTLEPIFAEALVGSEKRWNAETAGALAQGQTYLVRDGKVYVRIPMGDRAIVRHPTTDDPEFVPFGTVGPEYQLITPGDICTIWDEYVAKPVETMGVLRRGANFFVTSKLPSIDVKGDEVERYLGATCPLDGEHVATAEEWPLRVVCANTLRAAKAQAITSYRVVHDSNARAKMGEWLADAYRVAEANAAVLKEAFTVLAGTKVTDQKARHLLKVVYPPAPNPRQDAPADVMQGRYEFQAYIDRRRGVFRDRALQLYQGAGTGMSIPAAKGTAWGLYNAVVETEDYRRGSFRGGNEAANVAESTIWGQRADVKERAFEACMALAN